MNPFPYKPFKGGGVVVLGGFFGCFSGGVGFMVFRRLLCLVFRAFRRVVGRLVLMGYFKIWIYLDTIWIYPFYASILGTFNDFFYKVRRSRFLFCPPFFVASPRFYFFRS